MAGRGPAPKQSRHRRKAPVRGDWVRLVPLVGCHLPSLDEFEAPVNYESENRAAFWPTRTKLMWESWQEDPVTATWNKSDLAFAVDTIYLHAQAAQGKSSEIRIRMESLGLTPKGRADRRFLLPDEEEPPSEDDGSAQVKESRAIPEAI